MLHYSSAKKNKNQNDDKTFPQEYIYKDHKIPKNLSDRLPAKTRAELEDDIFFMRRHFKHTVKKLKHNLDYASWRENVIEKDAIEQYARLHPRHA